MYYFKPMMKIYGRFVTAETEWLMSKEGRHYMAKAIVLCRKLHGPREARAFRDALLMVGCLYPQVFPKY